MGLPFLSALYLCLSTGISCSNTFFLSPASSQCIGSISPGSRRCIQSVARCLVWELWEDRLSGVSAQTDPASLLLPVKTEDLKIYRLTSRLRGSWGHRRETGEIRRGRWEGASGT